VKAERAGVLSFAVNAVEEILMALLLVAMVAATLHQLAVAAWTGGVSAGAAGSSSYLLMCLVLLGMSHAVRAHAHLGVDAFLRLLGTGPRRACGLLAALAGLTYALLLAVGALEHIGDLRRLGTEDGSLGMPQWQLLAILPVGFGLLLLRLAQAGVRIWTRRQDGLLSADEAAEALDRHLASLTTESTVDPPPRRAAQPR